MTVLWHVAPDYGELDPSVVSREHDIKNGEKASGWTNPLGWSDDGHDDDLVVLQLYSNLRAPEAIYIQDGDDSTNVETDQQIEAAEQAASTALNTISTFDNGLDDDQVL